MQPSIADQSIEIRNLNKNATWDFSVSLTDAQIQDVKQRLKLSGLKKTAFYGSLNPLGKGDWGLDARLGATVTQACVVTRDPVNTRVETDVHRIYRKVLRDIDVGSELEMPEDVSEEQLPETLTLVDVFVEALSLALPDYPRAEGLTTFQADYTAPGVDALTDETVKPFAGLAALKDKLS